MSFEFVMWLAIGAVVATGYSITRPTKYRLRRDPGSTKYWIETRNGFLKSSEKHYVGGGGEGYPIFSRTYFDTRESANNRLYELVKKDKECRRDKGEKGVWL